MIQVQLLKKIFYFFLDFFLRFFNGSNCLTEGYRKDLGFVTLKWVAMMGLINTRKKDLRVICVIVGQPRDISFHSKFHCTNEHLK